MGPRVDVRQEDAAMVAAFDEHTDLDLPHATELGVALLAAVPNHVCGLVIDLGNVQYLDSAGVRMLFALARQLATRRQALALAVPGQSPLCRIIEITKLEEVAIVGKAVEECLSLLGKERSA